MCSNKATYKNRQGARFDLPTVVYGRLTLERAEGNLKMRIWLNLRVLCVPSPRGVLGDLYQQKLSCITPLLTLFFQTFPST